MVKTSNEIYMKRYIIKKRSAILVFLTHKIALPLLKQVRKPAAFTYSELELYMLPDGTLGKDLFNFLEKRNLPLLNHYARHDLKHVLLNYDTTDEGEACLQSFMLGNGRISFPVLAKVAYAFITMPEHWHKMRQAFRQGRKGRPIHDWKWNEVLVMQTNELRNKIFPS
jgi:Coenzyme Q (ubiquinone) biosynthesis protein Coq4